MLLFLNTTRNPRLFHLPFPPPPRPNPLRLRGVAAQLPEPHTVLRLPGELQEMIRRWRLNWGASGSRMRFTGMDLSIRLVRVFLHREAEGGGFLGCSKE